MELGDFFIDRVLIKGRIEGVFHHTALHTCPEPPIIPVTFLTFIILYHKFKSPGFVKLYLEEDKLKIDISVIGSESNHDFVGCMRIIIDGNYKLPTMVDRCHLDGWFIDSEEIREKEHLPVKQLCFDDTGTPLDEKEGRHTLGPLIYFEFKTTIQAVIIYSKGPTDYIKVSIHNRNQVYFQYVIGREPLTVNVQTSYNLGDDKCGVKPITYPSYIKETRPPSQVNEEKVRAVYNETDITILESVLAVILIALVIMAILIGRYMSRNKDEYLLHEDKSAEIALDPDSVVVNSVTGHQIQKKKEWFI
ncbi:NRX4 protein, partial [Acromyrmex charruanus]